MRTIHTSYGLRPAPKKSEPTTALPPTSFRFHVPRTQSSTANQTPIEFWRDQMAEIKGPLNLQFFRPENAASKWTIQTPAFEFPEETARRIQAIARKEVTTTFNVMLALWEVLLFRYSGQAEFMIGCSRPGTPYTVPARPMLMRASMWSQYTFRDVLQSVSRRSTQSSAHRGLSIDEMAEGLDPNAAHNRHPVFQIAFVQRHVLTDRVTRAATAGDRPPCDLTLVWAENSGKINGRMEHPLGLIDREYSEEIPEHFVNLAISCLETPDAHIGNLPLLALMRFGQNAFSSDRPGGIACPPHREPTGPADDLIK